MRALPGRGSTVLRVKVRDRFGDYGLVGVVVADRRADALAVDTLLLSCRVLGRGVEHAILRRLGELASEHGLPAVYLPYLATPKNEPARAFAESIAAKFRSEERDGIVYRIPVSDACAITHRPGHDPAAVIEARKSEENKSSASSSSSTVSASIKHRSERYANLARALGVGRRRPPRGAYPRCTNNGRYLASPRSRLPTLSASCLHCGSKCSASMGWVSRTIISRSVAPRFLRQDCSRRSRDDFGVKLRLTSILESPTVRALSRHLEPQRIERSEHAHRAQTRAARAIYSSCMMAMARRCFT